MALIPNMNSCTRTDLGTQGDFFRPFYLLTSLGEGCIRRSRGKSDPFDSIEDLFRDFGNE